MVLPTIFIINSIFERKARLLNIDITKAQNVKFLGTNSATGKKCHVKRLSSRLRFAVKWASAHFHN